MIPCTHNARHVAFPGGEALLTANGNWTVYLFGQPTQVFQAAPCRGCAMGGCEDVVVCPGCKTHLWGLSPLRKQYHGIEAVAHARGWRAAA